MHEWAVAEAVISAIMRESERAGLKKSHESEDKSGRVAANRHGYF